MSRFAKRAFNMTPAGSLFRKAANLGKVGASLFKKGTPVGTDKSARFSSGTYIIGESGKTDEAIKKTNDLIKDTGYEVAPKLSNRQITTYKDNEGNFNISHRGTCFSCPNKIKDVISDVALAVGINTKQSKNRLKRTEEIIDKIKMNNPNAKINMSGHSLGGHTSSYAIANSKKIRDNVNKLNTYNAGATPLIKNRGLQISADVKKELDKKVEHHRKAGDAISGGLLVNNPFGKVSTYKASSINTLKEHGLENFYK